MTTASIVLLFLQQQGGGGLLGLLFPMILVFGIFYFLVLRPQQKRQREAQVQRDKMLGALKPGDKVLTTSGIFATVVSVREKSIQLKIAQSVSIEVLRSAIAGLQEEVKEVEATSQGS